MLFPKIQDVAKPQRTLCLVKPDAIYRGLVGKMIARFEQVGLKLVYCRMVMPDKERVKKHYDNGLEWEENLGKKTLETYEKFGVGVKEVLGTDDPKVLGKEVHDKLTDYLMSGPLIVMVWQGIGAIEIARKIRGSTTPATADVGSIIGDYSHDSQLGAPLKGRSLQNLMHLSGNLEEAEREIKIWLGNNPKFEDYERVDESFF